VEGQAMTMLQEVTRHAGRRTIKFTPETSRRLRIGWQKEFHEKKSPD
jgi:hypothetical protein